MTALASISRHSRTPAILLGFSYAFLIVMMALHHHHSHATESAVTLPQPAETGHHSALDCPITYYAQKVFVALPAAAASGSDIVLCEGRMLPLQAHAVITVPDAPAVRGPPPTA